MGDPAAAIASAIARDGGDGIAVIYYPDLGLRDWLVAEVETIANVEPVARVDSVEAALARPDALVLLLPQDEQAAVGELDGARDRLLEPRRAFPVVLFLLREGNGAKALREAPSLASWIRGSDPDPERLAEIDEETERRAFREETGTTPEEWLKTWRAGELRRDARGFSLTYRASLLERP